MIHEHTQFHPWATLGIDLLLGVKADLSTTQREQHFLPENLAFDFNHATVLNPDGTTRPLVKQQRVVVKPGVQLIEEEFPLSPLTCALILLAITLTVFAWEWKRQRTTVWWDALLMLALGLAGSIVLLMFFSEHPATSTNLLVLLLNPLHLFFLPAVVRHHKTRYWTILPILIFLFLIGGIWQGYPIGMYIVALCLLIRFWSHLRNDK
jgi:hypothetical protein